MEAGTKEKIIRESMRHILCIDDEFIGPYDVEAIKRAKEGELEFSKNVYENLQIECGSHVDICRYDRTIEEAKWKMILSDRDLLVLDWELEGENSEPTLKMIYRALQQKIPFICIYTNSPDTEKIYSDIVGYFSGYSKETLSEICDKWVAAGVDKDIFQEKVNDLFAEKGDATEKLKKIRKALRKQLDFEDEEVTKVLDELKYSEKNSWYPLYLKWNDKILPDGVLTRAERMEKDAIIIDGMIIVCITKEGAGTENAVKPEQLMSALAKNIVDVPNSIFDIIWLKYSNALRNITQNRMNLFSATDARALGYFAKGFGENEEEFNHSMKMLFKDEIMDALEGEEIKIPKEIVTEITEIYKEIAPKEIAEQIVELNEKIMMNHVYSQVEHQVDFGDIFVTEFKDDDETEKIDFWMCITAKCDCCRPENIDYNYLFVRGTGMPNFSNALKDAEGKYRGFIKTEKRMTAIDWRRTRIVSIFIDHDQNTVKKPETVIKGNYNGRELEFTYLGNMKENYAQRIANEAFSHANRVGITLAQLR